MKPRSSVRYSAYRDRTRQRPAVAVVRFVVLFLLVYLVITGLFLRSVRVGSTMMEPTLSVGDRLFVSPLVYGPQVKLFGWTLPGIRNPARGDVVIMRPAYMPDATFSQELVNPVIRIFTFEQARADDGDGWRSAIQPKRIAGIPGDTVRIERFDVLVRPAGSSVFETISGASRPFSIIDTGVPDGWQADDAFGAAVPEITLGEDEYFVLSDNRVSGLDSRHWGAVKRENILAPVLFRYWPLNRAGTP